MVGLESLGGGIRKLDVRAFTWLMRTPAPQCPRPLFESISWSRRFS